jgi:hypothetical protein
MLFDVYEDTNDDMLRIVAKDGKYALTNWISSVSKEHRYLERLPLKDELGYIAVRGDTLVHIGQLELEVREGRVYGPD